MSTCLERFSSGVGQASKLATIQRTNARLYRADLLKEQLRQIYRLPGAAAEQLLDRWLRGPDGAGCRRS